MYKKAAIITLIAAPLLVDLASRAGETPPAEQTVMAPPENAAGNAQAMPGPDPAAPPQAGMTSDLGTPALSTDPVLDTTPQFAMGGSGDPAPPPPPPAPMPVTTTPEAQMESEPPAGSDVQPSPY